MVFCQRFPEAPQLVDVSSEIWATVAQLAGSRRYSTSDEDIGDQHDRSVLCNHSICRNRYLGSRYSGFDFGLRFHIHSNPT